MKALTALRKQGPLSAVKHFFSLTRRALYVRLRRQRIEAEMNRIALSVKYECSNTEPVKYAHTMIHLLMRRYRAI